MKLFWHYGKTFAALLILSLLLLMGQAACDLSLPSLMGNIAQNGKGREEAAAPEALSLQGMTLLECFMTDDSHRQMTETYLTVEPESSEARRLSEKYPGAAEQVVCVLREGLSKEQRNSAGEVYEKAAYALLLYLQQERSAGNLEDLSQRPAESETGERDPGEFRDNLRDDLGQTNSLPEGVLGNMPEGALFQLPSGSSLPEDLPESDVQEEASSVENSGGMMDSREKTFFGSGEQDSSEKGARANSRPLTVRDIPGVDIELLYTLLPRLGRTEESVFSGLISSAEQGSAAELRQAANAFKILFYRELGIPADHIRLDEGQITGWHLAGAALLGMLCAVLAILLLSRIVTLMGEQLRHDLNGGAENGFQAIEELKRGLPPCLCALCTVPVWLIGSTVLMAVQEVHPGWRIAVLMLVIAGVLLIFTKLLEKPFASLAEKLFRSRRKRLGWLFPLAVTLATWFLNLLCAAMLLAGGEFWRGAAAFVQYAVQAVLVVFLAGLLKAALSKAKELEGNLKCI